MSGAIWSLTWGSFLAGAAFWFVVPAVTAGAIASIYNTLGRPAVSISFVEERVETPAPK